MKPKTPFSEIKDQLPPTFGLKAIEELLRLLKDKHGEVVAGDLAFTVDAQYGPMKPGEVLVLSPATAIDYAIETCQKCQSFFTRLEKDQAMHGAGAAQIMSQQPKNN